MDEVRILATCTLGLGFSYDGFQRGLALKPHAIGCDAGSADFGPFFLGSNQLQKSAETLRRDLALLLEGACQLGVPFLTGSVGGAGGDAHVAAMAELVRDVAREKKLRFRMATVGAELSKDWLLAKLAAGAIRPAGAIENLTPEKIERLERSVAMMGEAPFLKALDEGAQVVIAGRATDPAIFVAPALRAGVPPGSPGTRRRASTRAIWPPSGRRTAPRSSPGCTRTSSFWSPPARARAAPSPRWRR